MKQIIIKWVYTMAKYTIDVDEEVVQFFKEINDNNPTEVMLVQMLKLLREIIETARLLRK